MGYDFVISVLDGSYWGFLTLWILLLAIAFVATFPEASRKAASKFGSAGHRTRIL
jgi:hypothetical protein